MMGRVVREEATLSEADVPRGRFERLSRGDNAGRYVILDLLGHGAMGVVYAAYDPELDRRVALKVLQSDATPNERSSQGQRRLLREAQAMARVTHRNVIGVHDVGTLEGDRVFVAMEFVEGVTLRKWLAQPRDAAQILDAFEQAGRGLAAAHVRDLVHRDFKPDNAMVDAEGRVVVLDFGLARLSSASLSESAVRPTDPPDGLSESAGERPLELLTRTGAVVGTPAYMAPEQHRSATDVDARADQFAWCVALYEALYGERPFGGATYPELMMSVLSGEVRPAPKDRAVPARIRRALLKGLSVEPDDRFEDMTALLEAIAEPAARPRRWGWWVGSVAVVGGLAGAAALRSSDVPVACPDASGKLAGIWDEQRRTAVRDAFLGAGVVYAADTWTRLERELDDYAAEWVAHRHEACEATHVEHAQSDELLDLRMACLDGRLRRLKAYTETLTQVDADAVEQSLHGDAPLLPLAPCADPAFVRERMQPAPDPAVAEAIANITSVADRAAALESLGKFRDALALARPLAEEARAVGDARTQAEITFLVGRLLERANDPEAARALLRNGYFAAARKGLHALAGEIGTWLVLVEGDRLSQFDEALQLADHVEIDLELGNADSDARGRFYSHRGSVLAAARRHAEAIEAHRTAVALAEARGDKRSVAIAQHNIANSLSLLGQHDEALRLLRSALEVEAELLGPEHPVVANIHNQIGITFLHDDRPAEAVPELERALALHRKIAPDGDIRVADVLVNLSVAAVAERRFEDAIGPLGEALSIYERVLGSDHQRIGSTMYNLAEAETYLGRHADAVGHYARALEIFEAVHGPEVPDYGQLLALYAKSLWALDRREEALAKIERALRLVEDEAPGLEERARGDVWLWAAEVYASAGQRDRARELARRAREAFAPAPERAAGRLARVDALLLGLG